MKTGVWTSGVLACAVAVALAGSGRAASTETSNGCRDTSDDPCVRSGSCEIQGSTWNQDVTIDRADIFDTQGWPGLCDMVHVGLVQGDCEPPGVQMDVTVHLSATSSAWIPRIVGTLACAGEPEPTPTVAAATDVLGRIVLVGSMLAVVGIVRRRITA